MAQPLLEIRDATKIYGGSFINRNVTVALQDYNLTIQDRPATITTIAGESGSGKSTLANLVLGFTKISSGQIHYKGVDITTMNGQQQSMPRSPGDEVQPGPMPNAADEHHDHDISAHERRRAARAAERDKHVVDEPLVQ